MMKVLLSEGRTLKVVEMMDDREYDFRIHQNSYVILQRFIEPLSSALSMANYHLYFACTCLVTDWLTLELTG